MGEITRDEKRHRPQFRDMNIRGTFFVYVSILLLVAAVLSMITIAVVDNFVSTVAVYYINGSEDIARINADNSESIRIALEMLDDDYQDSTADAILFYARNSSVALVLAFFFLASVFVAAQLFYVRKIKKPLRILDEAAESISEKNLNFSIEYNKDDEMGRLCRSFEIMRRQLDENNKEMWNMIEEQKRVQAAFSHDLRTPLTITMGYVDILHEYLPQGKVSEEKLAETIETIRSNLIRLENFVTTMSSMQKLSDITVHPSAVTASEFFRKVEDDGQMICWDKRFSCSTCTDCKMLTLDTDILEQIYINLLSNAVRFAHSLVRMECVCEGGKLTIRVFDDGDGFSEDALRHALDAYYSCNRTDSAAHFGLGLHICKLLSEKCGGHIACSNVEDGACVTVVVRVE